MCIRDRYELFLTIDFKQEPEVLAFYADAIGELPQLPTTCFSRSPSVIPMWAHYAQNSEGFAIEFDESELATAFPKSGFGDVDYRDAPDDGLSDTLHRAYHIGKPRYVYILHTGVFSAAYYTKATCWNYEQERRMIVGENEIRQAGDLMLVDVPHSVSYTHLDVYKRQSLPNAPRVRSMPAGGCAFWLREPGTDDEPGPPAGQDEQVALKPAVVQAQPVAWAP